MSNVRQAGAAELAALSLIFLLANLRALLVWPLFPDTSSVDGLAWLEISLWALPVAWIAFSLTRAGNWAAYVRAWRANWILATFVIFAALTISWSISPGASLYRFLCLLLSSVAGAFIGIQYDSEQLRRIIGRVGIVVLITTLLIVAWAPNLGTMQFRPYDGAWRGIYWHKNHLGNIVALFNGLYVLRLLDGARRRRVDSLDLAGYALSLVVMRFADSAAGLIVAVILHAAAGLAVAWMVLRHRLRRVHYSVALGIGMLICVAVLVNLEIVLGLFNRNTTLTGRVGLWRYLLGEIVAESPWLGHGFGALWMMESFRVETQSVVGWSYRVLIGDSGYIDILLHTGVVGLAVFLAVLAVAFARSLRWALETATGDAFVPLIILIHACFANIAFSLFLETESFVWLLIVAVLFSTIRRAPSGIAAGGIQHGPARLGRR